MLNPAGLLSLDHRLDVFARASDTHLWCATSFDDGQTWAVDWTLVNSGVSAASASFGPAAAGSGEGRVTHLVIRNSTSDTRMWRLTTSNYHESWAAWSPIGSLGFDSGPAVGTSGDGQIVYVVGRAGDSKMWYAKSIDRGASWAVAWAAIPVGVFLSGPAIAVSADGSRVFVFGRGNDNRIWWARSYDGAVTWNVAWGAIGSRFFQSDPAAAVSADGQTLLVVGRGTDNQAYLALSFDAGDTWIISWMAMSGSGPLISSPAVTMSWNGQRIHVFGQGPDNRIWRASSLDNGVTWNGALIGSKQFS